MRINLFSYQFEELLVNPDSLAVAGSDMDFTWKEFKTAVGKFSEVLKQTGISEGNPLVIYGHKEANFIAAIAACILNNIPYIPLDIIVPGGRIQRIIEITNAQVIFFPGEAIMENSCAIEIRSDLSIRKKKEPYFHSEFWYPEDPLVYIIFTSGSTGEPKGVQITRKAISSYIDWMEKDFGFSSGEVFINQASLNFDLSVYELMFFMHLGGAIILNTALLAKDSVAFVERIKKYDPTTWVSTPSFAYLYLFEKQFKQTDLPDLKTFLFCGEELPSRTASKLLSLFPSSRVFNSYGPTEATVATSLVLITEEIIKEYPVLPVGFPKYSSRILIDNPENEKEGEILIVGENVSVGYLKDPELSANKFFMQDNLRGYRTGDLGYFEKGMLFFSGRMDDQVKLNGFRIELGDISHQIAKAESVEEAVTIPLKRGTAVKKIISFLKMKNGFELDESSRTDIFSVLRNALPDYMIPGDIVQIDEFPYSSNHKIDKLRLAEIYLNQESSSSR